MKKVYAFICAAIVACSASATDFKFPKLDAKLNQRTMPVLSINGPKKQAAKITPTQGENFGITVTDITSTGGTYAVVPADKEMVYMTNCVSKEAFDSYASKDELIKVIQDWADSYIEYYATYGYELSYADFCSTGDESYTYSGLKANTEYVTFAYGCNIETLEATTEVEAYAWKTTEAATSENVITVSYADNKLTVTTTTNDPYVIFMEPLGYYYYGDNYDEYYLNDELAYYMKTYEDYGIVGEYFTYTGNQTIDIKEWWDARFTTPMSEGEYLAIVAGYEDGTITTECSYAIMNHTEGGGGETPDPDGDYAIDVVVDGQNATVTVTPSDKTTPYYFDAMPVEELLEFEGAADLSAYMKEYWDEVIAYYAQYGYDYTYADFASVGTDSYEFKDLDAGTWVVYAYAMDTETALATSDLTVKTFVIEEEDIPEAVDFAATIAVDDITATSATITVTPADDSVFYYWDMMTVEDYATFDSDAEVTAYFKEYFDYYIDLYAQYGYELSYEDFGATGENSYTYSSLKPGTDYVVLAFAMNKNTGAAISELVSYKFATEAGVNSDNEITMTYADGNINIATTNDDPYFFIFESLDEYETYIGTTEVTAEGAASEAQAWLELTDAYGLTDYFVMSGNQSFTPNDFWTTNLSESDLEDGNYVAFAVPYAGYVNGTTSFLVFSYSSTEGISNIEVVKSADIKSLRNGQVVIRRNNKLYNTKGLLIK